MGYGPKSPPPKENLFNKCLENWIATCKIMKVELYVIPFTHTNKMWVKDLKIKDIWKKTLAEVSNILTAEMASTRWPYDKNNKYKQMAQYQIKTLLHRERNSSSNKKDTLLMGESICISDKGLLSKIYKALTKLCNKNIQWSQSTNGVRKWIDISPKTIHTCTTSIWKSDHD